MSDALLRVKLEPDLRLWVPGQGLVERGIAQASRAVEDYDERLMLARHEVTGDWCVFLRHGPFDGEPFPVVGLGPDLPDPETIRDKLSAADTSRRGSKILDEMNAHNDSIQQEGRDLAEHATGIAAEAFEWGYRKMGSHPTPRIFVPRGA